MCPFFSFCFVLGTKWNINDLKNINYNRVNHLFFISVSKVCARRICSGGICPGISVQMVSVQGGTYMSRGKSPGVHVRRGGYVLEQQMMIYSEWPFSRVSFIVNTCVKH